MAIKPLEVMEAGLELWRRSLRQHLGRYYMASAPFVATLLWFGQKAGAVAMDSVTLPALVLALAFGIRAIGVGQYSRSVLAASGGGGVARPHDGWLRELWAQALLMVLWWVSLPCLLGLGWLYIAAQYVPLDPRRSLRSALRLSGRWWARQWVVFGLVLLLGGILAVNLGLAAVILPPLLHSIFGVGGSLSYADSSLFQLYSPVFWFGLLLAVYLALDPVMKCVMAVSYRDLQSVGQGADLEAEVERLRARQRPCAEWAVLLVALIGLGVVVPKAVAQTYSGPSPAAIQRALHQEVSQAPYAWHRAQESPISAWLGRAISGVFRPFDTVGRWLANGLKAIWDWLVKWWRGSPSPPVEHGSRGLGWKRWEWVLAGICFLLIAGLLWSAQRRRNAATASVAMTPLEKPMVDVAKASAADQDEGAWFAISEQLRRAGEWRLAYRAAFLGGLAGLASQRLLTLRRDRTNREYFEELARRVRLAGPALAACREEFRSGIRDFDEVWYGGRPVDEQRLEHFVAAQRELLSHG